MKNMDTGTSIYEKRQYQIDDVNYAMNHGKEIRPIHIASTGSGKTYMQAQIAKRELERGNTTAIFTPRAEIFDQTHSALVDICGHKNIGTLRSGFEWNSSKPIHIVSISGIGYRFNASKNEQ